MVIIYVRKELCMGNSHMDNQEFTVPVWWAMHDDVLQNVMQSTKRYPKT
jgi:hypothetical protein